ncbi:MAG: ATP-binding protein [Mycobacteriales bacterium]
MAAVEELGAALYERRLARGLSLRVLARRLGMSGHSGLARYEKGDRIPPADLIRAYERVLGVTDGALVALRDRALAERASSKVRALLGSERPPVAVPAAGGGAGLPARQLPPACGDFTGRQAELDWARAELDRAGGAGWAPVVLSVSGKPGVGKTAFAVRLAHEVADRYPDAHLYVDLRGAGDSPLDPAEVLARFLTALGVPDGTAPAGLDDRAALYRTLLRDRCAMVLLDNAGDEAQVRPLLPAAAGSLVVVTSRHLLRGLEGARRLSLDVPRPLEAVALLGRIAGAERVRAGRPAALDIVTLCGCLPLAVRIAGNRLLDWPEWTLGYLRDALADTHRRLAWLRAGDLDVRAAFELSYRDLPAASARLFRLLSLVPGPDFGADVAAVLLAGTPAEAGLLLEELAATSLIEPVATPGRYRLHDLLALFAAERRDEAEPAEARTAAAERLVVWLLATADAAADALSPAPAVPAGDRRFTDSGAALDWLDAEWGNVRAAARQARGPRVDHLVGQLAASLPWYFDLRCRWEDWREAAELSLAAAGRTGDRRQQAAARNSLGLALWGLGRFAEAADLHRAAAELARAAGEGREEAWALDDLGLAYWGLGRFAEAAELHREAERRCRRLGDRWGQALGLNHRGYALRMLGRFADAVECHRQALVLFRRLGDRRGEGMAWSNLGLALCGLRQFAEARDCHDRARALSARAEDHWAEGLARYGLGICAHGLGDLDGAVEHHQQALRIFEGLGDRYWQAQVLRSLGAASKAAGRADRAAAHWRRGRALFDELGSPECEDLVALAAGGRSDVTVAIPRAFLAANGLPGTFREHS